MKCQLQSREGNCIQYSPQLISMLENNILLEFSWEQYMTQIISNLLFIQNVIKTFIDMTDSGSISSIYPH